MKLLAAIAFGLTLAFSSPVGAQEKGERMMTVVICAEQEDALVGASEGAHKGLEALKEYLADPDNSCALVIPPVQVLFEREIKRIKGKAATMRVIEIKSLDGIVTGFSWMKIPDVSV